ncbi:cytochrome P450 [Streptomyces hiroshimensis]|uniref:Cytochrome P450 n=1 Tax=Streptomyces hiroshimensis TaxID=66424 RepID=A0ABQ2Y6F9_9ACTN|nr:cytochrome P450 [Streptomyces hiroshimensis]GGX66999.1 hypothetical protein GCM10010324_10290 [Streptomyces hiroshimensis]
MAFAMELVSHMLNSDPPDHTRLRSLVNKVFTARAVERLRPRIEAITHEMLDAMARQQPADLMRDFAYPLPMSVLCELCELCELLGVPVPDRDHFHGWVQARMSDDPARMMTAAPSLLGYLRELVDAKRRTPAADLLTDLVHAGDDDGHFPDATRLDITRTPTGHLAFGHGIHYCVGAPLARLEGRIAFTALLDRFPEIHLACDEDDLRWRGTMFRELQALPVRFPLCLNLTARRGRRRCG